ncbi:MULTISPECIES: TCR/Tet family MFS transporter [Chitinophaga]|uniref:TCR/Tet family MFS transporter n=1 Tax=Chitinophaga TaxID=79328 RepID=UPI000DBA68FE|nr:TCR/Tet family MFS transporter [Chitinophaga ginsengisegetis]MDR6570781.1 DHA1 family tetracycline resistance protein-like MFS transporter [Chitinophaga ginsengisegetis]MDR6650515.1 DHA1 family tetracycline resistance protein-like MFS transporter [Chitinophaga ginsengisegetis]MDR6656846.1 DHA1 family tetracycline resistance protein-like MFS transporter [Chitinophaga ginsengisegetis]
MHTSRKAAISFIFITLLIDVMGWGLIIPVMPELIAQLKHIPENEASTYGALLLSVFAITQFLFSPVIGNLSDKYGRRPVLLLSLLGFGIDYIILALAPAYGWLFAGRVIAGITGASFTTATAYIADVSTDETSRAKNFGLIGAAFGLGFVLGPALGGLLAKWGIRAPFYAAAALCLLNCLWGYFFLPESLSKENRRPFDWKRANPFGSLKFLTTHPEIGGLAFGFFLIYLGAQAVQSNWNFFTIYNFKWSKEMVGISLAVVGVLVGAVQAGLTRVINPRIGNEKSIYLGLALYAVGLVLFGFATQGWMMFVFLIPYCLGGICGPSLQSVISGHVPANQQGELQGALTSLMSLTTIIGPLIMNGTFAYFTSARAPFHLPGVHFLIGAVCILLSIVIIHKVLSREKKEHPELAEVIGSKDLSSTPMH